MAGSEQGHLLVPWLSTCRIKKQAGSLARSLADLQVRAVVFPCRDHDRAVSTLPLHSHHCTADLLEPVLGGRSGGTREVVSRPTTDAGSCSSLGSRLRATIFHFDTRVIRGAAYQKCFLPNRQKRAVRRGRLVVRNRLRDCHRTAVSPAGLGAAPRRSFSTI
jgi:hypothetical protein